MSGAYASAGIILPDLCQKEISIVCSLHSQCICDLNVQEWFTWVGSCLWKLWLEILIFFVTIPSVVAFKVIQNKVHLHINTRAVYKMYWGKMMCMVIKCPLEFVLYLMAISLHHDYSISRI
jgi:hypothetical protein